MAATPGRPHDPTVHPRTRPEAEEYAVKNRTTSDWFRHDGKNVEAQSRSAIKIGDQRGAANAEKAKGEADKWFAHKGDNSPASKPPPRCPTAESKACHDKIYGKEESWFKHEENKDYFSPRGKSRLPTANAEQIREKCGRSDTMDWYRHEHGKQDAYTAPEPKHRNGPQPHGSEHNQMLRKTGEWFAHDDPSQKGGDQEARAGNPRVKSSDAGEYLERDRFGTASNWFGHDSTIDQQVCHSPRVSSTEGAEIAKRLQGESESWYDYEANKSYQAPKPANKNTTSPLAKEMVERSRGQGMGQVLNQDQNRDFNSARPAGRAVKPEAQDAAEKNREGMMQKYLNQDVNKDYNSARPAPRVKQEALSTFEKNKGVMDDCMGGYPAPPAEHNQRRVRPEAAENADKNKGSVAAVMGNPESLPQSSRHPRVKAEAAEYAERNKGTLGSVMTGCAEMEISKPGRRLQSQAAQEIAEKNKGSLGPVLRMEA